MSCTFWGHEASIGNIRSINNRQVFGTFENAWGRRNRGESQATSYLKGEIEKTGES